MNWTISNNTLELDKGTHDLRIHSDSNTVLDSVIVATKHSKGKSIQKLPLVRTVLGKAAKIIIRHGLKVENVQDPLSRCFAISRQILEDRD